MWKILIVIVSILFTCNAQEPNCELEGVDPNEWLSEYKNDPVDDFEEEEFATFVTKNIKDFEIISGDYDKYFYVILEDESLKIAPTEAFKQYELEQESVANPDILIRLKFQCANSINRSLTFNQPITDWNTYPPELKQSSYTYQLPMPLSADFDISYFGDEIQACDMDISNTRLDFAIIPDEDFYITWNGTISDTKNKCHKAIIRTKSQIRLKNSKTYTITATDKGQPTTKQATAEFKVEIDEETTLPPNPQFGSAYYTANYNTETDLHTITIDEVIKLEDGCSKVDLTLMGDRKDDFDIKCDGSEVKVRLIQNLPPTILENDPIVLITIVAKLENAEDPGRTVLVLYLPKQECPQVTTINPSTVAPTECPICPTELTTSYTCPPCSTECPSIPTECPPCVTTPGESVSTPSECPTCTTIPGDCTSTECPVTCPTPEISSECPLCPTSPGIPTECPLTCPPIVTTPGDCPPVSTECPVSCPPEHTTQCPTTPIDCPSTECPISCPSPEPSTECPPCVTTTEPPPPKTTVTFQKDNYNYKIRFWNIGTTIGIVKATVTPKEELEYSITPDNEFLECDKVTGILTMTRADVPVGTYSYTAYAIGSETKTKAQTIVIIEVIKDDETSEPNVEYSVMVKHVLEDQDQEIEIELPCQYSFCEYTLGPQYPKTEDDIFRLENNILYVTAGLKRERTDIIDLLIPQFSLQFFLNEVGEPLTKMHHRSNYTLQIQNETVPEEWALIQVNVMNSPNQLFMSIVIDDINNNKPVFEIGTELIVGYPIAELAIQLTPPYLAKVLATDSDAGDNAIIRYSTESEHFIIHPETGVIYPAEDAFDDESNLKFTVTAKDRKGADGGLSTDLKIEVKPLTKENLIVLMVKNLMLEEIDETMKKLSEETGMQINYLTAAIIPLYTSKDSSEILIRQFIPFLMPRASSDHSSRIIVYGLDSDNKPVETDDLEEVLKDAGVLEDFTVDKWEPETSGGGGTGGTNSEEQSLGGYIAAISVLASLLAIFMIAAGVFYYFKIYKVKRLEPYDTMDEEDTNSVNFEKNPRTSTISKYDDPMPQRRVTGFVFNPPPIEEDEDEFGEKTYQEPIDYNTSVNDEWVKKDADKLVENKPQYVNTPEDDLYGEIYGESTVGKHEDSPTDDSERRKSVKFKETVEKINIVVDDRQDEQQDDILDERL